MNRNINVLNTDSNSKDLPEPNLACINTNNINAQVPLNYEHNRKRQLEILVQATTVDSHQTFTTRTLIDCGCTSSCINKDFAQKHGLTTHQLTTPIPAYNADGTLNGQGKITKYVDLCITIRSHQEWMQFLGFNWLLYHNLIIHWREGTIKFQDCPAKCQEQ